MMARQDTPQPDSLLYHPLTHPQKRVWYLEKLYPNTSLYNLGGPSRLKGEVDFDLLEEAINIFVQRNDALRLRFIEEGGEGKQYVAAFQRFTVPHFDFSGAANPEEEFTAWAEAELGKPFPLINSNLHYFAFFRIGPQNTGLLVKFHHLISDGWSIKVANEQVYGVYQKLLAGEAVPAESEPSYLEYISSEQNYLNSERFLKDRTFWMEKFRDLPEPVFTQSSENLAGRRVAYQLDNALSERIRGFITSRKCSLNTFYTSLFLIYLSKFSGQEDLIIGTPVLNRAGRKERSMFGMFTSTMPFRFFVDPLLSASKMLEAVNQELAGYYFHQKYPYDLFFQDLELKKKGYDSLFQVCVNYYNTKFDAVVNGEVVRNSELYNGNQFYSFQMIIKEWLGEGQITLEFDYKPDLYTGEQVDRIFTYLLQLTEQILADPSGTVKRLEMLPEAEKNRQVHVFNSTERDYPKGQTIIQLFEAQCAQTPTKPAVSFGELHLTYRELNRLANGLANELKMKGVVQNSIVGLLVNHSLETLIAILAVLKAGAAYLPIDPAYPSDRIEYMLVDSGCRVLLTNCLDSLGGVDLKTIFTGEVVPLVYDELPLGEDQNLKPTYGPRDPVYLIYTSGSTGKPKGVIIEHQGLVNYIWWARKVYVKGPEDVFALYSSLSFDLTVTSIFTPLVGGNRIIIYRDDGPEYVLYRIMKENQATIVKLTPSHLSLIKDQENRHSVVRCFIVGGEDLKVNLANAIYQSFGGKIEIYNEYGPTETVVGCMIHLFDPAEDTQVSVPIGIPADNVQIYLLASDLSLLPPGAAGEMYISGDGVARGYLNRPELTAEKFVSNPFISVSDGVFHVETAPPQEGIHETSLQKTPQRRMYRTGDLARFLDNGKIEYLG
ncbi:MAG TPA: amino acid adenylation domain-containing protein, partial [Bacillota bacterium]|nr:amino acid adenylation domain-containing protein [Bacillota bacterium]